MLQKIVQHSSSTSATFSVYHNILGFSFSNVAHHSRRASTIISTSRTTFKSSSTIFKDSVATMFSVVSTSCKNIGA